ncbi:hypothetical protein Pint_13980 [Pistacia integerrima]|uniref:Uncharacterized protein n=1 Tax=Pistacia integerrima TaxID=434235 RepID=A0ACC0YB77_9ROSI|nr:hypothetical protein Pint_13980 [Pistacia integerrima]
MRSGACTVQQTLTAEAASVLKHSLSLARRRGHAQVTPLHVAATLLSSRTSLLRRACLKSQPHHHQTSHPLQCRALELCFNVALNRLPTTPAPLLHAQPSLSNALIAALKRAQAHQRRGCIEQQQQQPLLSIKVELEQLIISILDDPSVSRVMREAGFSSTAIKNHVEDSSASSVFQCYSASGVAGVFSSPCSPSATDNHQTQREIINPNTLWQNHFLTSYSSSEQNPLLFSPQKKLLTNFTTDSSASSVNSKEDIKLVFEVLVRKNKRRNTVIVGDSASITEGLVVELMGRVERGDVPEELKKTQVIKFQFAPVSLRFMKKEDIETNVTELKRKVDSLTSGGAGAIIYTGDLKWTVDHNQESFNREISSYSPINHLVSEIGRIVSNSITSNTKVWLVATASYQTYMKCQMKQPSLEIQWALQAVSVPSGGLCLSLHASCVQDSRSQVWETKPSTNKEEDELSCCAECTYNYENEAQLFKSGQKKLLPPWLQSHSGNANQKDEIGELRKKWNKLCQSLHQGSHFPGATFSRSHSFGKSYSYASTYPWWSSQTAIFPESNSISFAESAATLKANNTFHSVPRFRRQQSCTIEFNFGNDTHEIKGGEPSLDSLKSSGDKEVKITLALGNSLFSEKDRTSTETKRGDLCKVLQEMVPWQSGIPSIVEALVDYKSAKNGTWLLIQGDDIIGKRRLARGIAESLFGSADLLLNMSMRKRNDTAPASEILSRALKMHEKLVVFVEDADLVDTKFIKLLAEGSESGIFGESRNANIGEIVFILSEDGDKMKNEECVINMTLEVRERSSSCDQKRKAEWDFSNKTKSPRIEEKDAESGTKKDFSRHSSFNTLDLNMKADGEDNETEEKLGDLSPISSDLTRETTANPPNSNGFLDSIRNRFVFNRNLTKDEDIRECFLSKLKECFEEVFRGQNRVNFSVEERVIDEVLNGRGLFVKSLFDKWVTEIFQTSLKTVKIGGKEGIEIKLCFGGKNEKVSEDGFKDSCLPKKIKFSV